MGKICLAYICGFLMGAQALRLQNQETLDKPILLKTFDKLGGKAGSNVSLFHDEGASTMTLDDGSCKITWNSSQPVVIAPLGKHCEEVKFNGPPVHSKECRFCVHMAQKVANIEGYNERFVQELLHVPEDKRVVVDVGANIGMISRGMAAKGVKVYWFEPGAYNNQVLEANVIANSKVDAHHWRPIVHVKAGASDIEQTLYYEERGSEKGNAYFYPPGVIPDTENAVQLKTVKLQDHVDEEVFFFKMDVQGFESHVLEGSVCLFCQHKVHNLRTEFCPTMMKKNGNSDPVKFLKMIQELGFDFSKDTHERIRSVGMKFDAADLDLQESTENTYNQFDADPYPQTDLNFVQRRAPSKAICEKHSCKQTWNA